MHGETMTDVDEDGDHAILYAWDSVEEAWLRPNESDTNLGRTTLQKLVIEVGEPKSI